MSTQTQSPAGVNARPAWRRWFPWAICAFAGLTIAGLWLWPDQDWEDVWRVLGTQLAILITGLLLLAWLLVWSGIPWATKRKVLLALVVAGLALGSMIADIKFTGNMRPIIVWRWTPTNSSIVEQHRKTQPANSDPLRLWDGHFGQTDWPAYRGARRDGVVKSWAKVFDASWDWTFKPPHLLWKQPVGGGYAGFAVVGNLAVTIEQRWDQEVIAGYDTATGRERWTYAYPALFSEKLGGKGPRATPTIANEHVYALGATGMLTCLDAFTGNKKWVVDILEDNDNLAWGMSGSPLVYDDVVVVSPGKQRAAGATLVAYDRATGQKRWAEGSARAGYSSPMLVTLSGKRQIIVFDGEGLASYDDRSGKELWRVPWETNQGINVAQPIVLDGDRIFISSGYGVGCAMLQVALHDGKWAVHTLWTSRAMRCKFTCPVAHEGHLYGLDEGILVCVDEKTGMRKWREGRYGHGQMLLARSHLLILTESGELALVSPVPICRRELMRMRVFDGRSWNNPALAAGKVYLRNDQEMACYDLTGGSDWAEGTD
jgi:outer membrane protein assembly factor BamB